MLLLPPQNPPVARDPRADDAVHDPGAMRTGEGVEASQSKCAGLTGPAQSLCYAALYGVYV